MAHASWPREGGTGGGWGVGGLTNQGQGSFLVMIYDLNHIPSVLFVVIAVIVFCILLARVA